MKRLAPFSLVLLLLITGCALYKLEKQLDPDSREFLSKVRYIITARERKTFLNLPASEREAFIEEFWKKRDPTPDTEENEYKNEYFKRIEEANRLFSDGGGKGWLEDRGRIYILIGPPEQRLVYPRGMTFYDVPTEVWYYGFFPIVFTDEQWNGTYELTITSAYAVAEINKASTDLRPKITREEVVFDFSLRVKKAKEGKGLIQMEVPYKNIWFNAQGDRLKTTLALSLEVLDSAQKKVWDFEKDYLISLSEKNVSEFLQKAFVVEIPITLEPGKYTLHLKLVNETDKSLVEKNLDFEL